MSDRTRPTGAEITEGLGALAVIAAGLVAIPLLLVTIIGWPLPHHIPTISALHSAATSPIPDSFWPKALATIAWLAWGYFVYSLVMATFDVIRFRRRGTWRRAVGKTSMAALVTAVIVLASIRLSATTHGSVPIPAVVAVPYVSPSIASVATLTASQTGAVTHTVVDGESMWDIAVAHYGDGEQWRSIADANTGVRQRDGFALAANNWVNPGWKLTIPYATTSPTAPAVELVDVAAPTTAAPPTSEVPVPTATTTVTHAVVAGDNLWSLAVTYYGNGEAWHTIYAANVGVEQSGGGSLSDPSLIYPGWVLTVPDATTVAPATASAPPATHPAPPPAPSEPAPLSSTHSLVGPTTPATSSHVGGRIPAITPSTMATVPVAQPDRRNGIPGGPSGPSAPRHVVIHQGSPELPDIAIGGLGVLAAAVIARSLRHRRRLARVGLRPGEMIAASSAPIRDLESALAALVDTPTVDWLDVAMHHLTQLSVECPGVVPPIRLVRVGRDGVDLILAEAAGVAPGAFEVAEDGWAWTLSATNDLIDHVVAGGSTAWFAALVPVGEDVDGRTYLAPIEPGTVLPITGPGAPEAQAAMAATAESWSWAEHVTVTSDPAEANTAAQAKALDPSRMRDRVLYLGSPGALGTEVLSAVGIVTTDDVQPTDLAVICTPDGTVEIYPTQLRLNACRLPPEADVGITEAMATAETQPSNRVPERQMTISGCIERSDNTSTTTVPAAGLGSDSDFELEVRVLTNSATITNVSDVQISRNGRHFELIALLALSGGLTKEDARASIYGSGSSIENVANLASQARKMLGVDSTGQLFLPEASTTGINALSSRVTTDLTRLCQLVDVAATAERSEAINAYIKGLDLIEVTPALTVSHTWNWWVHYGTIAESAALAAACNLAKLTIEDNGDVEAARHGINQARAVAPYAEELYRSSIELAGAAGNMVWAQREWDDLRRMLSDLSPGATPSAGTKETYFAAMQHESMGGTCPGLPSTPIVVGTH